MKKTNAFRNQQGTVPPLIYLSEVLQDYGNCEVPIECAGEITPSIRNHSDSPSTKFECFLANKIECADIILFDVHSLDVIRGGELREILQYLRNRRGSMPTDIGIENGRDYYLDRERAMQAISETNAFGSKTNSYKGKASQKNAYVAVVSSAYGPLRSQDWDIDRVHISNDEVMLRIANARVRAKGLIVPTGLALRKLAASLERPLPAGAKELSKQPNEFYEFFYMSGKFNRMGLPALSLGAAITKENNGAIRANERHVIWQSRLNDLYLANKNKSHTALCEELAELLYDERRLRDSKKVSSSTIRRSTTDPGKRKPGGSKPKAVRTRKQ